MSDNDMNRDTEMQRLEAFVDKLLKKYSELKEERNGLLHTISERDSAIVDLEETVAARESTLAERDATIVEKDATIVARDEAIADLEGKLDDKQNERSQISEKVNSIMDQLESWELSLDDEQHEQGDGEEGDHGEHHDMF